MFILEEAEHFYNAYEVLNDNREALVKNINDKNRQNIDDKKFGYVPTLGVDVVCLSFSVELYIKGLHFRLGNKVPRGHNVLKLFNKLPDHIQKDIFSHPGISKYGWTVKEFEREMDAISNSFEEWRYSYEKSSIRFNTYFAIALVEAVKSNIPLP